MTYLPSEDVKLMVLLLKNLIHTSTYIYNVHLYDVQVLKLVIDNI